MTVQDQPIKDRWLVLALATLAMLMDGFDSLIITVAAPDMVKALALPLSTFGAVLGCGQIGVALGALIFGWLGDRYSLRVVTLLAFALFTFSTLATPLAREAAALIAVRFVAGLGIGGLKPLLTRLVREFNTAASGASAVSLMYLGYGTGGVAVSLISAKFLAHYGWEAFFLLAAGLSGVVLFALLVALPKDTPSAMPAAATPRSEARDAIAPDQSRYDVNRGAFARLFGKDLRFATIALVLAFGMNSATQTYFSYWIPTQVRASGGSPGEAGVILAVYLVGGILGGLGFIKATALLRPSIAVVGFGAITAFVALQLLTQVPYTSGVALALFALAGAALLGSNYVILGLPASFFPTSILASGSGLCVFSASVGGVVGPWLGGYLLEFGLSRWLLMTIGSAPLIVVCSSIFLLNRRALAGAGIEWRTKPPAEASYISGS